MASMRQVACVGGLFGRLAGWLGRFGANRDGNFTVLMAFATGVLFLTAGLAVEYTLALSQRTRITNALDAATLATARAISIGEVTQANAPDYLKQVFAANIGVDNLATSRYSLHNIVIDPANNAVSAKATYNQQLKFINVGMGTTHMDVSNNSAVTFGASDIEVAMVLDVTGSMDWDDANGDHKMTSLKAAAKNAVDKLLKNSRGAVKISLVPYSQSVNVGSFLSRYVYADYLEPKSDAPAYDAALFNSTGVGYDYAAFQQPYKVRRWRNGRRRRVCTNVLPSDFRVESDGTNVDYCATDRKAPDTGGRTSYQFTDENPVRGGMISRDSRLSEGSCISEKIVTLTTNKRDLDRAIDRMGTNGGTAGHIGLQWAWYTISHKWRDYLPATSRPGDHMASGSDLNKYIIFMTDGVFNTAYAGNSTRNGWTGHNPARSQSPQHTSDFCRAIKQQNIKIFVVGFDLDETVADSNPDLRRSWIRDAQTLLRNCATPDTNRVTYFYKADDSAQLTAAFENIAQTIRSLRLTH
ncbi:pilus assembly protein TadG-related protein [Hoeflea sp. TYP-13]|uniref:pilus assembly protein TadG-related protein n=1 Tax=Hoeflea sp. TYP-13 TaxID=3230023 RepID=UPI0034C61C61